MTTAADAKAVPTFQLYGEQHAWATPDLLHWESIAERSRLHDWTIKPHRHSDLWQILYLRSGHGHAQLDGKRRLLNPPCLVLIPPLIVHGFGFSPDVRGHVLTLGTPLVSHLEAQLNQSAGLLHHASILGLASGEAKQLNRSMEEIAREYRNEDAHRDEAMQAQLSILLIRLLRRQQASLPPETAERQRGHRHFIVFSQTLESDFREHKPLSHYAVRAGISVAHLNDICRQLANQSALQLIHQRLLLEAKRHLIYTSMTVSEISDALGFSEPAYFTRFFKRLSGKSPRQFRNAGPLTQDSPDSS